MSKKSKPKIDFSAKDISDSQFFVKEQDNGSFIISDGNPLKSPGEKIIESTNRRLLKHIADELNSLEILDPNDFNSYSIFCIQFDILDDMIMRFYNDPEHFVFGDPTLRSSAGPERVDQYYQWESLFKWLENKNLSYPDFIMLDEEGIKNWIETNEFDDEYKNNVKNLIATLKEDIEKLTDAQKAGLIGALVQTHSIMYSLLLVQKECTSSEFANAVFAGDFINPKAGINEGGISKSKEWIEWLTNVGNTIRTFIDLSDSESQRVLDIINLGESQVVEFKATLRTSIGKKIPPEALVEQVLKSITAFCNEKRGGTLFVGVKDDGEILGIEKDNFENNDDWLKHLTYKIRDHIKPNIFSTLLTVKFQKIQNKFICEIKCKGGVNKKGVWLKNKYYGRMGPSTKELQGRDALKHIEKNT